jgi:hypothetical protein
MRTPGVFASRKNRSSITEGASIMGKYFLAWILGVPAIVLLIIYFIF